MMKWAGDWFSEAHELCLCTQNIIFVFYVALYCSRVGVNLALQESTAVSAHSRSLQSGHSLPCPKRESGNMGFLAESADFWDIFFDHNPCRRPYRSRTPGPDVGFQTSTQALVSVR